MLLLQAGHVLQVTHLRRLVLIRPNRWFPRYSRGKGNTCSKVALGYLTNNVIMVAMLASWTPCLPTEKKRLHTLLGMVMSKFGKVINPSALPIQSSETVESIWEWHEDPFLIRNFSHHKQDKAISRKQWYILYSSHGLHEFVICVCLNWIGLFFEPFHHTVCDCRF